MRRDTLFVTGMQRSGTTLLARLLDAQPGMTLLSQPFPLLFVAAKRAFLLERAGVEEHYALGHLFLERRYRKDELDRFLAQYRIGRDAAQRVFREMESYSGQYTRPAAAALEQALGEQAFAPLVQALCHALARPGTRCAGAKETTCEEFLPHLLQQGFACVLLLRDPRDVLASLNHGRGPAFGGSPKPTLFNLRQWRKSVAFALELEGSDGFHSLRYEDLVRDPAAELGRLDATLRSGPLFAGALDAAQAAGGDGWPGNSSHGERRGVSQESVGAHRELLAPELVRFVEAACHAEMRLLGYSTQVEAADVPHVLRAFREPYATRADLAGEAPDAANLGHELRRFELLHDDTADDEGDRYTLFPRARVRLAGALRQ